MKHKYKIFGYKVESDLALEAYTDDFDLAEIGIELGKIDKDAFGIVEGGWRFSKTEKLVAFYIPEIGAYQVINGNRIIVQPDPESEIAQIQLFLLGSAFGFLMHQRLEYPIHGSAIDFGESSLIFVGHSGAGKSSLASGFVKKGYKILTDDVSRIDIIDGIKYVYPSYPSQKIWKDAISEMDIKYDSKNQLFNRVDKFYVNDRNRFSQEPKPLKAICEIVPAEVTEPQLVRPEKREILNILITHSYRQEMMGQYTNLGAHLKSCTKLAMDLPVYRLLRPKEGFTVEEQTSLIEALISN